MILEKENEFTKEIKRTSQVFTHGGKFHADDVFSYALLRMINPDLKCRRGNKVPEDFTGIVFDIGGGIYDHHQVDSRVRENGIPYASLGLLWERLGEAVFGDEKQAEKFDRRFIQPLDFNDNTGEPNEIASLIRAFNPVWDEKADTDAAFLDAVDFAEKILEKKIAYIKSNMRADAAMEPYLSRAENGILIMDQYVPWKKAVEDTDIEFVIFPSNRGGYCAMGVKDDMIRETKCSFPEEWYGKRDEELIKVSGISTLRFCHKTGFMLSTDTLEDAKRACELSKKKQKKRTVFVHQLKRLLKKKR